MEGANGQSSYESSHSLSVPKLNCASDNSTSDLRHDESSENQLKNFSIFNINVCGLVSKLECPEFISEILKYDIICVEETKTDETNELSIPGFKHYVKHRQDLSRIKSGGIALYIKDDLSEHVHIIESRCKYVLWCKFDIFVNNVKDTLLLGVIYIPPEGSKYVNNDVFEEIEEEYFLFSQNCKYVSLIGDFNGRTGNLSDLFINDDDDIELTDNIADILGILEIPLQRSSQDTMVNNFGKMGFAS